MPKPPEKPEIPGTPESVPVPKKPLTPARKEFRSFLRESAISKERPRPVLDNELRREIERLANQKTNPGDFEETAKKP